MRLFYSVVFASTFIFLLGYHTAFAKPDEQSKVNQLIELSTAYRFSDIHRSIATIDDALLLAQKIEYKAGIAECYLKKGQYLFNNGSQKESGESLKKAADLFKEIDIKDKYAISLKELADYYRAVGNQKMATILITQSTAIAASLKNDALVAECEIASGTIDMNTGKFAEATEHFLKALQTAETIKNDEIIMNSCRELGNINSMQGNIPISNDYFKRSLAINLKIGNRLGVADAYCNIGANFLALGNESEAASNINKSLALAKELNYKPTIALDLLNLGYCNSRLNEVEQAKEHFEQAGTLFRESNDRHGEAEVLNAKGYLDAKMGNYEQAAVNYLHSAEIAKPINANDQLKTSYDGLAYVFERRKDFEAAYKFQKMAQGLSDQLYGTDNAKVVTKLQLNYDFQKLREQQRIQQELKDQITDSEKKRALYFQLFLVILGILFLALAAFAYIAYRANRKAKMLLTERNELITVEKERAERILSDIIPAEIEAKIKQSGIGQIEGFATVMFVDFNEFSKTEQKFDPISLMDELDIIFKGMDDISKKFQLETLKTLSDGYLCIGGLANSLECRPEDVVNAAIKIQLFMDELKMQRIQQGSPYFEMKIGVHTGQIAGGIVGVRTIAADIWGETVQVASMLEKRAQASDIYLSESTYHIVKAKFQSIYSGLVHIGSKDVAVYQLTQFRTDISPLTVSDNVNELLNRL